jgi:hypothetical protein
MRTATIVLSAYGLLLLAASVWRHLPPSLADRFVPDLVALAAAHLGLTARSRLTSAVAGSVVLGYLGDLVAGAPPGLFALAAGVTSLVAHAVHRRLLVRGWAMTLGFSMFVGTASALLVLLIRGFHGMPVAATGVELMKVLGVALATAMVGPPVLRLFRRIDAAFARTHRERDAALEGLVP